MPKTSAARKDPADALPSWDLSDLYASPSAPEWERDLASCEKQAKAFAEKCRGKVGTLDAPALGKAIAEYEAMDDLGTKLMSYADLVYNADMTNPESARFYQTAQERLSVLMSGLVFFTLDLNLIEDAQLEKLYQADKTLAKYRPWLDAIRIMRPYQLEERLEKLLLEKQVTSRSAFNRLFDETVAALTFEIRGKTMNSAEALHLLSDKDGSLRKDAAKEIGRVFGERIHTFAFITNTLAKDKEIEDSWRGFKRPISSRNLSNLIEDEVVDALLSAVKASYPKLSHRYYAMKAKWLGMKQMDYWDRNAPLPQDADKTFGWNEARDTVLSAYNAFSPKLAKLGQEFFDKPWIDAAMRPGKSPGAFAHPTAVSAHPYLLLNFQGKARDVMTLAHELGHGVHQVLAAKQGALLAPTPLTLAETASVFGEQLTFQGLLKAETDPLRRSILIAGKVEDMLNTVVRQVAFCEFERLVHDERRKGELSPEQLGAFWLQVQRESLGSALRFDDEYQHYWAYIPHFVHSPFYVYAYAFGDCLVNSLYAVYREGLPGFEEKYFAMLEAGGTLRHKELLAPFGLDATDPAFWNKGLAIISEFIDQLEASPL